MTKCDKLGILREAKDLVMEVDVDKQSRFPEVVCRSTERPDAVLVGKFIRLLRQSLHVGMQIIRLDHVCEALDLFKDQLEI